MRTIWKYRIDPALESMSMPLGAEILSVGLDPDNRLCAWVFVDPEEKQHTERKIRVFGTGHDIPAGNVFIGTAKAGPFMWHVFEQVTALQVPEF